MGNLLVVNDDMTTLRLLELQLVSKGHKVVTTTNVLEAMTLLTQELPDLIITDIHMPGIDGWQFCRLLKSDEYRKYNNIPILFVSATEQESHATHLTSRMQGVGFVRAPWELEPFLDAVHRLLDGGDNVFDSDTQVLVADDDPIVQQLARSALEGVGYVVTSVDNGLKCIEEIQRRPPHLLLLDQIMPEMTGVDVLAWLKQNKISLPVVMITAGGSEQLAVDVMKMGAYDYVNKPLDVDQLRVLCRDVMDRYHASTINREFKMRIRQIKEMQEQILEVERLRTLTEVAGGAAHEIFQPLTVALGSAQMLQPLVPDYLGDLVTIERACLKIEGIVKKMSEIQRYATKQYVGKSQIVDFDSSSQNNQK
jgi:CheY-like chemotaxis protein